MKRGKVKWFSYTKGYGFIDSDDGYDVYVHRTDIPGRHDGNKYLEPGDIVMYNEVDVGKGPRATNIVSFTRFSQQ